MAQPCTTPAIYNNSMDQKHCASTPTTIGTYFIVIQDHIRKNKYRIIKTIG